MRIACGVMIAALLWSPSMAASAPSTDTGGAESLGGKLLEDLGPAPAPSQMPRTEPQISAAGPSIGQYLIQRLQDYGIRDVFGIPGDYILSFYSLLEKSPINVVGCTREDCAGFAADAYARVNGMGAVCVTYCVGGLSVAN